MNAVPGIYATPPRSSVSNLDMLPIPDRSLVDLEKYNLYVGDAVVKNRVTLQATRGCPYKCVYCHKIWPKKHFVRSAENIFEEVNLYYQMGVRRFGLLDDIFNLNVKNSRRFFELILRNGLDVQFFFPNGMRGDILTKDYIDLMFEAGTTEVALALETGSPRLQKLTGRDLDIEKLRVNLEYIIQRYPHVILGLFTMHGFPTETEEEAMMTLNFIKDLKWLHFPLVNILKIFPDTEMEKMAIENGITRESIIKSANLAYHELPDTLPFEKSFSFKYKTDFLHDYFLSKERLLHVLPYQMKVLTEDEFVQKYNSYLPLTVKTFDEFLQYVDLADCGLTADGFLSEEEVRVPDLNRKLKAAAPVRKPAEDSLKVLLLDLSQFFENRRETVYDIIEPPLGLICLLTYLYREYGDKVNGKIAKARIDFNSYAELKTLLEEFKPDLIGLRTLTFYKDFFHETAARIRDFGFDGPIIAGGPYATSGYKKIVQDSNIDVVVLGEGEITFAELVGSVMDHNGKLPGKDILKEINGIVFVPVDTNFEVEQQVSYFFEDDLENE